MTRNNTTYKIIFQEQSFPLSHCLHVKLYGCKKANNQVTKRHPDQSTCQLSCKPRGVDTGQASIKICGHLQTKYARVYSKSSHQSRQVAARHLFNSKRHFMSHAAGIQHHTQSPCPGAPPLLFKSYIITSCQQAEKKKSHKSGKSRLTS